MAGSRDLKAELRQIFSPRESLCQSGTPKDFSLEKSKRPRSLMDFRLHE